MIWTADTPLHVPPAMAGCVRLAVERLVADAAAVFGRPPRVSTQPAPFGVTSVQVNPDPAFAVAVPPEAPETFAVVATATELAVAGTDAFGTVLGLAWLSRRVLTGTGPREAVEVMLTHEQASWPEPVRAWRLPAGVDVGRWGLALIGSGGNAYAADTPSAVLAALGLRHAPVEFDSARLPVWW